MLFRSDLMEWFAIQCVDQMVQDIQSRVTPEEWEKIVAEAEQAEELGSDLPDFMDLSM